METQKQTLTRLLRSNPWVCGTVFQSAFIPEYRSLINKIRKDGTPVEARKCRQHNHRGGRLQEWSISSKMPPSKDTCPHCNVCRNHSINCPTKAQKSTQGALNI